MCLTVEIFYKFQVVCPGAENGSQPHETPVTGGHSTFDTFWDLHLTVPIYLAVILFPLMCLKSATFFTKFNALGKNQSFSLKFDLK